MSGRPLTHSSQISEQLEQMNARFEAKTQLILDRLPPPRAKKTLSDEERATLEKLGYPIPDEEPQVDPVSEYIKGHVNNLTHHVVESNKVRWDIQRKIDENIASIRSTVTGISWAVAILMVIVVMMWISSWKGCEFEPIPGPEPNPAPIPAPGPNPTPPRPNPIPNPTPQPPGVIQLDSTEMEIYRFAIAHIRGNTDAERRASLNFLLGNISQKAAILAAWPNEQVELLP